MKNFLKSKKLNNVLYDIRGKILDMVEKLENDGYKIIKLNIGNMAAFGFDAPEEIVKDINLNLKNYSGYTDSKGIFFARKAIMQYCQEKNIENINIDDIYIGNGVSELILFSMNALLDDGDEVLVPSPDYPLWTAAINLSGGKTIHYNCDEENDWNPNFQDIENKITEKTKAIVIINPNNPTGALYDDKILKKIVSLASKNNLIIFSDEIYDKIVYDDLKHISIASFSNLYKDVFFVTFGGLSKNYRSCGYRSGWMILSGNKEIAKDYIQGLNLLSSMRLCSNTAGQLAIQTALHGYQSINDLVKGNNARLLKQRDLAYDLITKIPGVSCIKPKAALYLFPKLDKNIYKIEDDQDFILDFLQKEKVLLVQGTAFNIKDNQHFRITFLPHEEELKIAIERLARYLSTLRK